MTKTIKLYNAGKRNIQYGKGKNAVFKPGTTVEFPEELGNKLHKLYGNEVKTPEDHIAPYVADAYKDSFQESAIAPKEQELLAKEKQHLANEKAALAAEQEAFAAEKVAFEKSKKDVVEDNTKKKRGRAKEYIEKDTTPHLSFDKTENSGEEVI